MVILLNSETVKEPFLGRAGVTAFALTVHTACVRVLQEREATSKCARRLISGPSSQGHRVIPLSGRRGGAAEPSVVGAPRGWSAALLPAPRDAQAQVLRRRLRATGLAPASASMDPVPIGHLVQLLREGSARHLARPWHPSLRMSPSSPCVTLSSPGRPWAGHA